MSYVKTNDETTIKYVLIKPNTSTKSTCNVCLKEFPSKAKRQKHFYENHLERNEGINVLDSSLHQTRGKIAYKKPITVTTPYIKFMTLIDIIQCQIHKIKDRMAYLEKYYVFDYRSQSYYQKGQSTLEAVAMDRSNKAFDIQLYYGESVQTLDQGMGDFSREWIQGALYIQELLIRIKNPNEIDEDGYEASIPIFRNKIEEKIWAYYGLIEDNGRIKEKIWITKNIRKLSGSYPYQENYELRQKEVEAPTLESLINLI